MKATPKGLSSTLGPNQRIIPFGRMNLLRGGVIVFCLTILYFHIMRDLVYDWIQLPDFSHGFLIPIMFFYFVYERRTRLLTLAPSGQWTGLILLVAGVLLYLLGKSATEFFIMRFSMLIVVGGIILFLLGWEFFRSLLFPLVFLVHMIPIPSVLMDRFTFPMQIFASKMAASSLSLIGIPVLREGNIIQLANASLEVAEACSGIRSLISLVTLSVVFAYFNQKTMFKRFLLVACAFPVAIIANAIRVAGTGVLAYHYGDAVAQGFFHGFSGWVIFLAAFACLFLVGLLLSPIKPKRE